MKRLNTPDECNPIDSVEYNKIISKKRKIESHEYDFKQDSQKQVDEWIKEIGESIEYSIVKESKDNSKFECQLCENNFESAILLGKIPYHDLLFGCLKCYRPYCFKCIVTQLKKNPNHPNSIGFRCGKKDCRAFNCNLIGTQGTKKRQKKKDDLYCTRDEEVPSFTGINLRFADYDEPPRIIGYLPTSKHLILGDYNKNIENSNKFQFVETDDSEFSDEDDEKRRQELLNDRRKKDREEEEACFK